MSPKITTTIVDANGNVTPMRVRPHKRPSRRWDKDQRIEDLRRHLPSVSTETLNKLSGQELNALWHDLHRCHACEKDE